MDGTITIPHKLELEYPVELGSGETVKAITFNRRPTTGDLRGVKVENLTDLSVAMTVACRISDMPVELKNKVDGADGIRIMEVVTRFLESGL